MHAILGGSDQCVALSALGAVVHLESTTGERELPLSDFYRLPGNQPQIETALEPGELITFVEIPALDFASNSTYRKLRDRASYAFALVSVAAAVALDGDRIEDLRLAMGGVATKPWRAWKVEAALKGQRPSVAGFRSAVDAELADAKALNDNAFKIDLARRTVVGVLSELTGVSA
jgi:xanthine dehydrogenase YagS FAD-binding subunit